MRADRLWTNACTTTGGYPMSIPGKQRLQKLAERAEDWIVDRGTRAFAWVSRSAVEDTGTVTLSDGEDVDVYWFSSKTAKLGQATVFNTILLNRTYFERLTPIARELILRHELGHANRRPSLSGVLYGMVSICAIGVLMLGGAGILAVSGEPVMSVTQSAGYGAACIGLFLITNRIEETTADLEALRVLGEDAFIDGYQQIDDVADKVDGAEPSLFSRILRRLCYTHPETVVRLNRLLERAGV